MKSKENEAVNWIFLIETLISQNKGKTWLQFITPPVYADDCKHTDCLFFVLKFGPGAECEELNCLQRVLKSDITESEHQLHSSLTVEPGAVSFT